MALDKEQLEQGTINLFKKLNIRSLMYDNYIDQIRNIKSASDISKLKNAVKKEMTKRFTGMIQRCGADENWLAEELDTETIESLGKFPKASLKYLESDFIDAITSHCLNEIANTRYSLMLPKTSESRFLILYLFVRSNTGNISHRLNVRFDDSIANNIITNNEVAKTNTSIDSSKVSSESIQKQYIDFLDQLGLNKKQETDALASLFISISHEEHKQHLIKELYRYNRTGIAFISCEKDDWDIKRYTVGILAGGIDNTTYSNGYEKPYTEWCLYSKLYVIQFIKRASVGGSLGIAANEKCFNTDFITAQICNKQRLYEYGNMANSFKAYKSEIDDTIKRVMNYYKLGAVKVYDKRYHTRFIKDILEKGKSK